MLIGGGYGRVEGITFWEVAVSPRKQYRDKSGISYMMV